MIKRALVVGLGSIGRRHLRLLRQELPDADIRILRHSGCDEAIEGSDGCYDSLDAACDFKPELAVIASPAPFHIETAMALAKVGAHLLVEKPLSAQLDGVESLVEYCRANDQILRVGYNLRFLQSLQTFRQLLQSGAVGSVYHVRCEIGQYLPDWRPGTDYRTAVSAQSDMGGGVLLELSHELDLVRWLLGDVEWTSAWYGNRGDLDIDVEDCALLNLQMESGVPVHLVMDFLRRDTTRCCTAVGEYGTLRWDAVASSVEIFEAEAGRWKQCYAKAAERDESYRAQLRSLLAMIASGIDDGTAASGEDGLAIMEVIEALRTSHRLGGKRIALHSGNDQ